MRGSMSNHSLNLENPSTMFVALFLQLVFQSDHLYTLSELGSEMMLYF